MTSRRTTPTLVETAIKGAQSAGLPFTAVEVRGGGVVRILLDVSADAGDQSEGNSCDVIFETRSD